ncbi:hypothetical protein [Pseudolysinimonas sp.]|uniref:hypothetical protein n=1 Tax=Pseudolysinimonas sp. TaxID=2680009 RepID=UPI003F7D7B77
MSIATQLPGARVARTAQAAAPQLLSLATKRPDLVEVSSSQRVVGYIEVVEHLFVALAGPRYDLAVEIAQAHDFTLALHALQEGIRDDDI